MDMPIKIPWGNNSQTSYIEWMRVTYKATSWIFNYYDWERKDVESISWIIVWWWLQFDTQKWKPSKKKSISYVSNEFWFEIKDKWKIKMREHIRENWEFKASNYGIKTYQEWRDEWMRLTKVVYLLDTNLEKIYKIQFAWMSFWEIVKLLKDDLPNFVVTIKACDNTTSTDNGEFYMPTIVRVWDLPEEAYEKTLEKVKMVYDILNNTSTNENEHKELETACIESVAEGVFDDIP